MEEMPASSRKYPFVGFEPEREAGKDILTVEGLTKTVDGVKVLDNVTFTRATRATRSPLWAKTKRARPRCSGS